MGQGKTPRAVLLLAVTTFVAALGTASPALAVPLTCDNTTGVPGAGECQITTLHNLGAGGTFEVDRTLHIIGPTGELRTNASSTLTLNIAGGSPNGLIIDSGGLITGNATGASGIGATININVATGNILLAASGATISAANTAGGGCGHPEVGRGGVIIITANGTNAKITTEAGTLISVGDSLSGHTPTCPAGAIKISAPNGEIEIDGSVLSQSTRSGDAGATQRPGGGPIFIIADCALTISETGLVSSKGTDPGADLVHLEGCVVQIFGIVESTGHGHAPPKNPPNSCDDVTPFGSSVRRTALIGLGSVTRPGKPASSTACVEVWAGTTILIDSLTGSRKGEVNADIGFAGGTNGRSWIELFARGDINVVDGPNNDHNVTLPGSPPFFSQFAVHANMLKLNTGFAGDIRAWTIGGSVTASGNAFQADNAGSDPNAPPGGGTGGSVDIEAALNLNFNAGSLFARGDYNSAGGFGVGGDLVGRAFQGSIQWTSGVGDVRPSGTQVPVGQDGTITLTHCTVFTPGATFPTNGSAEPPFPNVINTCPGPTAPTLPVYVTLPPGDCLNSCGLASKSGMKFRDIANLGVKDVGEPGLQGWEIHLFNADLSVHLHTTTDVNGNYSFPNLQPGTYTVCETLQANWTQTFPNPGTANCTTHTHGGAITPGPNGYLFTLTAGENETGNDFGNFQAQIPNNRKSGIKFNDLNGNGVKDIGEPVLQGWEIHMFDKATGGQVFHEHRFTDVNGQYLFAGVQPNTYIVCETIQAGWVQTFPTSGADCSAHGGGVGYEIVLGFDTVDDNNDFGNRQIVSKSGTKFNDLNGIGGRDPGEPGLQGWTIHLFGTDINQQAVDKHVTTDANGNYEFSTLLDGLLPGTYTVCETLQAGFIQTFPTSGADCTGHNHLGPAGPFGYAITLNAGDIDTGNDFGNRVPNAAFKRGLKFNDLNGNGQRDAGEPPLEGWTIHIFNADLSIHQHTQTAADGTYQFTVPAGTYTVCETVQSGWTQTFPTPGPGIVSCAGHTSGLGYQVTLVADQIDEGNDFGNNRRSVAVPTLSEWGMLLFVLLLIGIACRQFRRKQGSLRLG